MLKFVYTLLGARTAHGGITQGGVSTFAFDFLLIVAPSSFSTALVSFFLHGGGSLVCLLLFFVGSGALRIFVSGGLLDFLAVATG